MQVHACMQTRLKALGLAGDMPHTERLPAANDACRVMLWQVLGTVFTKGGVNVIVADQACVMRRAKKGE